ncbi:hypothetical protein G7Y89_g14550 [Cudoniella acicularis]|uniref:Uncharacterized protein n=1 Tax=Cudoniella acicularis TaxID=354080 RepID=A0A8H4VSU4_9HELO|nr:hypothetical protein G7Y89_g14550 [Cudoniella acicularis]
MSFAIESMKPQKDLAYGLLRIVFRSSLSLAEILNYNTGTVGVVIAPTTVKGVCRRAPVFEHVLMIVGGNHLSTRRKRENGGRSFADATTAAEDNRGPSIQGGTVADAGRQEIQWK